MRDVWLLVKVVRVLTTLVIYLAQTVLVGVKIGRKVHRTQVLQALVQRGVCVLESGLFSVGNN